MNPHHCIKCGKPADESTGQSVDVVASDVTSVRVSSTQGRSTFRNITPLHVLICHPCFLKLKKHILRTALLMGGFISLIGSGVIVLADSQNLAYYWILILMLLIFPSLSFFVTKGRVKPGSGHLKNYLKIYLRKDIVKKIHQQYNEAGITPEGDIVIYLTAEFEAVMKSVTVTRLTEIRKKTEDADNNSKSS